MKAKFSQAFEYTYRIAVMVLLALLLASERAETTPAVEDGVPTDQTTIDRWEYAILEIREYAYWGSINSDWSMTWLLPPGGKDGIIHASVEEESGGNLTHPYRFFIEAIGGVSKAGWDTEASFLSAIGQQGWRLIERSDSEKPVDLSSDRKATSRKSRYTFVRATKRP